ncbi:TIGR04222 domain-containing membrane protein [Kitasatospora sp. NPDC058170]|uniref:TIGR04222 domain-containing membrane protein n=1 Tax=Kitasatospora sp. NPDC058170 TaxID=3346364 RepID=UPI0036DAA7B0
MWHNTYFIVPAVLLVLASFHASRTKQLVRRAPQAKGLPGRGLPLLDTAFLSGGPGRVFDTALVRMHEAGHVIVNRSGLITITAERPYDSVDQAVIEAAGPDRQRPLAALRHEVMRSPAVQKIGDGLADRGLLRNPARMRRARTARRLLWLAVLAVVATFGLAFVIDDGTAASERPALWVAPVLLGFALVSLLASWPLKGRITPAGRRQLSLMAIGKPWKPSTGLAPRTAGAVLLGAVALSGVAASGLEDAELQEAMLAAASAELLTAKYGSSATASSGSGSSCSSAAYTSSCSGGTWCGSSSPGSSGSSCGSSSSSCGSSSSSCGSSSSSCGSSSSSCSSSSSSCGGSSCGS